MKLTWTNIKSGEERTIVEMNPEIAKPQISAFWASSDMAPNSRTQDYGWRLSPALAASLEVVKSDPARMAKIQTEMATDHLDDVELLWYLTKDERVQEVKNTFTDEAKLKEEYEAKLKAEIDRLAKKNAPKVEEPKTVADKK